MSTFPSGRLTQETVSWFHANPARSNPYCLYCGAHVGAGSSVESNREHWIGRNFVPKGTLTPPAFNFIFRACSACNARKAVAERHISAATLVPILGRSTDPRTERAARRKAVNDFHPEKPGVPMGDAGDRLSVEGTLAGLSMSIQFVAPPRANLDAVVELSFSHIQALFALLTTLDHLDPSQTRLLPRNQMGFYGSYVRTDWGNPILLEAERRSRGWWTQVVESAGGHFRVAMRRKEVGDWFWALEWNQYLRVIGVIGDHSLFDDMPKLGWKLLPDRSGRYREEVSLRDGPDPLFESYDGEVRHTFLS